MGESSACLVRSMSQPSPTATGEETVNHMQSALTASISFGRFMSESLDWVKWSAFTQNRYLEEVEKYSKPGSVAEKKAYFEAHFKRRRAAAVIEQQNAASNVTASGPSEAHEKNEVKDDTSPDLNFVHQNTNEREVQNSHKDDSAGRRVEDVHHGGVEKLNEPRLHQNTNEKELQNCQNDDSAERMVQGVLPGGVENLNEPQVLLDSPEGLTNHIANAGRIDDDISKSEDKTCKKIDPTVKESEASSLLPKIDGAYKCVPSPPIISIMPVQLKNGDKTPASNDNVKDSGNKRRSYSTSLHMSINLASCLGETQKCVSPVRPKAENTSLNRAPAKRYKNSVQSQTSTMESIIFKHHHVRTTQPENRTETIHSNSLSRNRTLEGKVQSPSTKWCTKSSAGFGGCKPRLTTVACPFTFKSEERAAKRREKQEQKLRSNDVEKPTANAKPQVKERDNLKPIRNDITTKPIKIPEIFKSMDLSNNMQTKTPPAKPCLPKVFEERASFKVVDSNNSRPPWRVTVSAKNDTCATGKNGITVKNKRLPINRISKKNMSENASPNIQL